MVSSPDIPTPEAPGEDIEVHSSIESMGRVASETTRHTLVNPHDAAIGDPGVLIGDAKQWADQGVHINDSTEAPE